jgi:hypothetical protein
MEGRYWLWLGARLLMAVIIVGWAFSYLTPGGSGEKEFQKSLDAMKQVRSVRVATVSEPLAAKQHNKFTTELVCAQNGYHTTRHLVDNATDTPTEFNDDTLEIGSAAYRRATDGTWQKSGYASGNPKLICSRLAQGDRSNLLPDFATMIKRAIIDKGDKKTVNGVRCREWKVALKGGYSGLEHDTICIGLNDHLPYEMTVDWERSRTTYSDYNAPFQLEAPDAALQQTSSTSGSN